MARSAPARPRCSSRATCGERDAGILRVTRDELDALFAAARPAGIGLAIHAIGDRAVAAVLDAPRARIGATSRRPGRSHRARAAAARCRMRSVRRPRDHRQRPADPRRGRPRPRRGVLGRPPGGRLRLAHPRTCRGAPGGRLRRAGRIGQSVARRLRGRPPTAADPTSGRLAIRRRRSPSTEALSGLHARPGPGRSAPPTRDTSASAPGPTWRCSTSTSTPSWLPMSASPMFAPCSRSSTAPRSRWPDRCPTRSRTRRMLGGRHGDDVAIGDPFEVTGDGRQPVGTGPRFELRLLDARLRSPRGPHDRRARRVRSRLPSLARAAPLGHPLPLGDRPRASTRPSLTPPTGSADRRHRSG